MKYLKHSIALSIARHAVLSREMGGCVFKPGMEQAAALAGTRAKPTPGDILDAMASILGAYSIAHDERSEAIA